MTKLKRAYIPESENRQAISDLHKKWLSGDEYIRKAFPMKDPGVAFAAIREFVQKECDCQQWRNELYQVAVREFDDGKLVHLSIKRNDRQPIHDWRDLQEIKNQLVGPECEAVELYPAESRRVDSANQYHLWAVTNPDYRFPFGFQDRFVTEDTLGKSVQRPL